MKLHPENPAPGINTTPKIDPPSTKEILEAMVAVMKAIESVGYSGDVVRAWDKVNDLRKRC